MNILFLSRVLFMTMLTGLIACASARVDTSTDVGDYFNQHEELMGSLPTTVSVESPKEKFKAVFADFNETMTEANLRDLYAESIYFNDTFVTLKSADELVAYMQKTSDNVQSSSVKIVDVARSDSDYYLRWVMEIEFLARGKLIKSRSIGMTQLRFDAAGKVVFHQDYWDSANAFYQHLPIVGGLVKRIKNAMH